VAGLAGWQGTFGTPEAEVVAFVRRAIGVTPVGLRRLVVGDENEVYRVDVDDAGAVYVRIQRPGATGFDPELWAMGLARDAGIPVPALLGRGPIESADGGVRDAMVIAAATGTQLSELLPTLTSDDRRLVMHNIGTTVAELHAVGTPGVGRPDPAGVWPAVEDEAARYLGECRRQIAYLERAGLARVEIDAVDQLIGTSPDTPTRANPVLCHGDLHAAHVFLDDHRVTGIIDWGLWHGGSIIDDLSSMSMVHDQGDVDAILAAHGPPIGVGDDLRDRLALSVVHQALGHIAWHVDIGNERGVDHYVTRLRSALDILGYSHPCTAP